MMREKLKKAYEQNGSLPVAFLDETYRTAEEAEDGLAFYVVTAILIRPAHFESIRGDLQEIVGGRYWYTTENLVTEQGRNIAREMSAYLGEGDEPCVFSINMSTDREDAETLREKCLLTLMKELNSIPLLGKHCVDLFVLEARRGKTLRARDQKTMSEARRKQLVRRSAQLLQVSPSDENLLWLPDLASSAMRQKLSHGNTEYLEAFKHNVREL